VGRTWVKFAPSSQFERRPIWQTGYSYDEAQYVKNIAPTVRDSFQAVAKCFSVNGFGAGY